MTRAVAVLALTAALGPVTASAADRDRELLERHRPLLVYDEAEKWRAVAVDAFVADGLPPRLSEAPTPSGVRDVAYGRIARDDGREWLQYWFFFAYNGQDRGIVRTGRHEGDWEVFQVRLAADGTPDAATFSQHSSAAACRWNELEKDAGAPRVYVANASHALYPRRGSHDRPFPDPNDQARPGHTARADVRPLSATRPEWVRWDGRWGQSRAGFVPGEESSPYGPAHAGERWSDPAGFHDSAHSCLSAPGGGRWVVPTLLAGGTALALVVGIAFWRRRPRKTRKTMARSVTNALLR